MSNEVELSGVVGYEDTQCVRYLSQENSYLFWIKGKKAFVQFDADEYDQHLLDARKRAEEDG